jgi:hypothetical protein
MSVCSNKLLCHKLNIWSVQCILLNKSVTESLTWPAISCNQQLCPAALDGQCRECQACMHSQAPPATPRDSIHSMFLTTSIILIRMNSRPNVHGGMLHSGPEKVSADGCAANIQSAKIYKRLETAANCATAMQHSCTRLACMPSMNHLNSQYMATLNIWTCHQVRNSKFLVDTPRQQVQANLMPTNFWSSNPRPGPNHAAHKHRPSSAPSTVCQLKAMQTCI